MAKRYCAFTDEGRKRVILIAAEVLASHYTRTSDDLFSRRQGNSRTVILIAAIVKWARENHGEN